MESLTSALRSVLIDGGYISEKYRISVRSVDHNPSSDWATIVVDLYRPRCRKPCGFWELALWLPGNQIHFERSNFCSY